MKTLNKMLLLVGICLAYILIVYLTFYAVAKVHRTNDPVFAKKVVLLTFFVDVCIFAGSGLLVYKLKFPTDKK
jgi:FtsH-binding integral membrane protein